MTEFTTELYNGILITTNTADNTFNVSRLIKHYQPKNKDIARYLKSIPFKVLYDKTLELYNEKMIPQIADHLQDDETSIIGSDDRNLTHENYLKSFNTVRGGGRKKDIQGLYLPREFLNIVLMILDPTYRFNVNKVLDTINELNHGEAPTENIKIITNNQEREIKWKPSFDTLTNLTEADSNYWTERELFYHNWSDKMF
jgi:hypothetical protein